MKRTGIERGPTLPAARPGVDQVSTLTRDQSWKAGGGTVEDNEGKRASHHLPCLQNPLIKKYSAAQVSIANMQSSHSGTERASPHLSLDTLFGQLTSRDPSSASFHLGPMPA